MNEPAIADTTTETITPAPGTTTAAGAAAPGSGGGGDPGTTANQFKWPDQWRQQIATELAGDNKDLVPKYQKQLEQHLTPVSVYKQNVELRKKMDSGELKKGLSDNPSPDELAAYRKANGIPETPDKYDIKPEGPWAEEQNKANFDNLLKFAHSRNMKSDDVKALADFLASGRQSAFDAIAERDEKERSETEELLRQEWGNDYKVNQNLISSLLDGEEEGFKDDLFNARLSDGTKLINDPAFNKLLARLAREVNPAGAIMPSGTTDAKSIDDEIDSLRKLQSSNPAEFWSDKVQKRLLTLQGAKTRIAEKA